MNKKILISLSVVAVVAAIAIGGTIAYFSDTETSGGNLFKAGTIDIHVQGDNFTWEDGAIMEDMKPCYTDYINLTIYNDGSEPNPVNVWKTLENISETTGAESEPECTEQGGYWDSASKACDWDGYNPGYPEIDDNNVSSIINYDLSVVVYNATGDKIWWQTIYTDDDEVTVSEIANQGIYLGMIPAGGKMEVTQSYHMQDPNTSTNWAQGDEMAFDIKIEAIQLRGTAWLDNKTGAPDWEVIDGTDGINGVLTYIVKNPTFAFSFTGTAPQNDHNYVLAAGFTPNGAGYDVDTQLGTGHSSATGVITITGDLDTGSMKDVKVWLVPEENWDNGMDWSGPPSWPDCAANFLWETGLIWYEDTDEI